MDRFGKIDGIKEVAYAKKRSCRRRNVILASYTSVLVTPTRGNGFDYHAAIY